VSWGDVIPLKFRDGGKVVSATTGPGPVSKWIIVSGQFPRWRGKRPGCGQLCDPGRSRVVIARTSGSSTQFGGLLDDRSRTSQRPVLGPPGRLGILKFGPGLQAWRVVTSTGRVVAKDRARPRPARQLLPALSAPHLGRGRILASRTLAPRDRRGGGGGRELVWRIIERGRGGTARRRVNVFS